MSVMHTPKVNPIIFDRIRDHQEAIHDWLSRYEGSKELPLYSSVDIRNAGFKMSVVDTNIFPAGFNNLCEHGLDDSVSFIQAAINSRVDDCRNILIIAEEHTRNTWYLENVRILEEIIGNAGFDVKVATFLTVQPAFCEQASFVQLETATGQPIKIHCFKNILERFKNGQEKFDLIIMNNDLIGGIPDIILNAGIPIYPSIHAGWHSRLKSHHFRHAADLFREFGKIVDLDPWLFSAEYRVIEAEDINSESDRKSLAKEASVLFEEIHKKYQQHGITEKPYVVLKADAGTYGMGVLSVEDPQDIIDMNRKNRNRMAKGKGSGLIKRYLLQEGVPTKYNIEDEVSEVCIYQIENNLVGGFYRSHSTKNERDNLNSKGMGFKTMCPHLKKYGDCGVHHDINIFDIYRILARIAGIAAHREILQLESKDQI